jgi:hypothetical protein
LFRGQPTRCPLNPRMPLALASGAADAPGGEIAGQPPGASAGIPDGSLAWAGTLGLLGSLGALRRGGACAAVPPPVVVLGVVVVVPWRQTPLALPGARDQRSCSHITGAENHSSGVTHVAEIA